PQSKVEGEPRRDFPVILEIGFKLPVMKITAPLRAVLKIRGIQTQQKVRDRIVGVDAAEIKGAIGLRKQVLALDAEDIERPGLQHMRASHHAEIVGNGAFTIARVHGKRKNTKS